MTLQGDSPETDEADGKGVTLRTLHAAKGLEFSVVDYEQPETKELNVAELSSAARALASAFA